MPYVPEGRMKNSGQPYGGYDVELVECSLCENLYAKGAEDKHALTVAHAAVKAALQR